MPYLETARKTQYKIAGSQQFISFDRDCRMHMRTDTALGQFTSANIQRHTESAFHVTGYNCSSCSKLTYIRTFMVIAWTTCCADKEQLVGGKGIYAFCWDSVSALNSQKETDVSDRTAWCTRFYMKEVNSLNSEEIFGTVPGSSASFVRELRSMFWKTTGAWYAWVVLGKF